MNKRILGGLAAAAMLAGGFAFTSAGTVSAEQSDTVNHPVCAGLVKDIAPGDPTPIAGIVYVKAGDTHTDVGFHEAGYVAPSPNQFAVSHVDVCPVPTREPLNNFSEFDAGTFVCGDTTVVQTRTKTTTTYTPTISGFNETITVSQETQTRVPTEAEKASCLTPTINEVLTPTAPTPDVVVAATPPIQASLPPVAPAVAPAQAVAPAGGLPATGIDGTGVTALIALLLTSLGGAALLVSRRYNVNS